jgi:hypothetical protein
MVNGRSSSFLLSPCKLHAIVSFNKQDLAKHLPRKQQLVLVVEDKLPLINPNRSLGRLLSFYPHIDVSLGHLGIRLAAQPNRLYCSLIKPL